MDIIYQVCEISTKQAVNEFETRKAAEECFEAGCEYSYKTHFIWAEIVGE